MSNLDDFYLADIFASAQSNLSSDNPSDELHKSMSAELSRIENELSLYGKEFFRRWSEVSDDLQSLNNTDSFNLGLRLGAKYIYELFVNEVTKEEDKKN